MSKEPWEVLTASQFHCQAQGFGHFGRCLFLISPVPSPKTTVVSEPRGQAEFKSAP